MASLYSDLLLLEHLSLLSLRPARADILSTQAWAILTGRDLILSHLFLALASVSSGWMLVQSERPCWVPRKRRSSLLIFVWLEEGRCCWLLRRQVLLLG